MSVRTAQTWQTGPLPSETKTPRQWRTRHDPFEAVWESELVPLPVADQQRALEATTLIEWLGDRHRGEYGPEHLRTLQRRIRDWRALHGPDREVYFEQRHPPGRETFEALVAGLQGAFWELGGVTEYLRSDNLSAATHELQRSAGRALNTTSRRCSTTTG